MDFIKFRDAVNTQIYKMTNKGVFVHKVYRTDISPDELWNTYMESFPDGTNPMFKERRVHDCRCCRQFIKAIGNMVVITDDLKVLSIWDVLLYDEYKFVAKAMSKAVKSHDIAHKFLHEFETVGKKENFEDNGHRWDHFYCDLPSEFVEDTHIGTIISSSNSDHHVFQRGLKEISGEAIATVLDLIDANQIYRGEEHKPTIMLFWDLMLKYNKESDLKKKKLFEWANCQNQGARIRNSAIGTLLLDVSIGMDLEKAVSMFENKMYSYKRTNGVVTPAMIKKAKGKIESLGYMESLPRRNAVTEDLTINNVLFADRSAKVRMGAFDEMLKECMPSRNPKNAIDISIDKFIKDILPGADEIELLFENKHKNNLMSLVAPVNPDAPGLFKWGNNFSWAYNGDMADSIKEQVRKAGGKTNAYLRLSLAWNNYDDLDIHVREPRGINEIYFENKGKIHKSSGMLDVDANGGGGDTRKPVENITYSNPKKMPEGIYEVYVHQYKARETKDIGFSLEIEHNGKSKVFHHKDKIKTNEKVMVLKFQYTMKKGVEIINSLKSTEDQTELWNIKTKMYHKVKMIMNSPNHWDGENTGNKHLFFILENCHSGEPVRGFFNEYLSPALLENRKVFDVLGSKMKTDADSEQLSGLGFSSTKNGRFVCRVTNNKAIVYNVIF